jgi:hypothetical protein
MMTAIGTIDFSEYPQFLEWIKGSYFSDKNVSKTNSQKNIVIDGETVWIVWMGDSL